MGYKKIIGFTEEEFKDKINKTNQELVMDFLSQQQLSDQTLKQYKSALYIFCKWVYENKDNKDIPSLKPRDGMRYQNYLIELGLSSSAIKFKRSAVSSLYGYIEVFWGDEHPNCRNIFSKAVPGVQNTKVKESIPLTKEELDLIVKTLKKEKDYQKLAFFLVAYESAGRRAEIIQLKKEIISYEVHKDKKTGKSQGYYFSHIVRGKGKGKQGKPVTLLIGKKSMSAIKKWLDYRGCDECEYIFATKRNGEYKQISINTTNTWVDYFGEIIGRKINPHLIRKTRSTDIVVNEGKDIRFAQKLLHHEDSSVTEKHYVIRSEEDDFGELFD